jgi:uncharacterized membrane protein
VARRDPKKPAQRHEPSPRPEPRVPEELDELNQRDASQLLERFAELIEPKLKRAEDLPAVMREVQMTVTMSGPLPPPGVLGAYGDVSDDVPNRIIVMAEKEQSFRHEMGRREMGIAETANDTNNKALLRGQGFGVGIVLALVGVGVVALWTGRLEAGWTAFASGIAIHFAGVVAGRRQDAPKPSAKREQPREKS